MHVNESKASATLIFNCDSIFAFSHSDSCWLLTCFSKHEAHGILVGTMNSGLNVQGFWIINYEWLHLCIPGGKIKILRRP